MAALSQRPVALVTGASRRIGAAIAEELHASGYALALHYRHSASEAQALADDFNRRVAGSAICLQAELGDPRQPERLVEQTLGAFGRLDGLINNASIFYPTPIGQATEQQWDELIGANARAPFFLAQAALPALRERHGAIVNLVDLYAERALADHPIYVMAKAALAAMTRTLAADLGPQVRVNAIAPGAILWPEQTAGDTRRQAMLEATPLARLGSPEEIAVAVRWLLRDAGFVTGQILTVDGGRGLPVTPA